MNQIDIDTIERIQEQYGKSITEYKFYYNGSAIVVSAERDGKLLAEAWNDGTQIHLKPYY